MGVATSFDESNHHLGPPKGVSEDECYTLSTWQGPLDGQPVVVSCWKFTAEELAEINRTGRVWLMIWGATMPPACVLGTSPFQR